MFSRNRNHLWRRRTATRGMPFAAAVMGLALVGSNACTRDASREPAPPSRTVTAARTESWDVRLINRVWRVSSEGRPPGSMYIFLTDGSLLMTSCVETYRLATWRGGDTPGSITITEDANTRYEATIRIDDERSAQMTLHLRGGERVDLSLTVATVPDVCPDLPR